MSAKIIPITHRDVARIPEKYTGNFLQSLIDGVDATQGPVNHRCGMFRATDSTGESGEICNAPTDFVCKHCGPICRWCIDDLACSGPTANHEIE